MFHLRLYMFIRCSFGCFTYFRNLGHLKYVLFYADEEFSCLWLMKGVLREKK